MHDGRNNGVLLPLHQRETKVEEKEMTSGVFKIWMWRLMLAIGVVFYGSYSVLVHLCKNQGHLPFKTSSVVLLIEVTKLLISLSFVTQELLHLRLRLPRLSLATCAPYAVPAILYTINNNIALIMQLHMDPTTYQVLTNLKIATTALLYKYIIKREITVAQWVALGLLMLAGVFDSYGGYHTQILKNHHQIFITFPGLLMMMMYVSISGLAAVYTEYILKKQFSTSLHLQNSMLYMYGIMLNSFVSVWQTASDEGTDGFFTGFTHYTWVIIITQALNGLILSIVMKHGNNLTRLFIISGSMLYSTFLTMVVLGTSVNAFFLLAAALVIISLYLYHS